MTPNVKVTLKYFSAGVAFALTSSIISPASRGSSAEIESSIAIADRVLVTINNIPYSQNQVESYIDVKESLRDDAMKSQTVDGSNWTQALEVFVRDTAIHQEASKSSGFRPTKEAVQKLRLRSEKTAASVAQFKTSFDRLGLAGQRIEIEILKIATVESFRRGKQSLNSKDKAINWETELTDRTTVRYFDDAKTWKQTNPIP
ncbi:MAG: hypothetical protein WCO71_01725 [Pseudomonadota bacterium]